MDDVDSIPVVHLDDLPPMTISEGVFLPSFLDLAASAHNVQIASERPPAPSIPSLLRAAATTISTEPFVIDREGEMPKGAISPVLSTPTPGSQRHSRAHSPALNGNGSSTLPPSTFPPYIVEDEIPRSGTPEPIKVVRAKKKGTGTGKKTKKKHTSTAVAAVEGGEQPSG